MAEEVAVVRQDGPAGGALVAFVVLRHGAAGGGVLERCRQELPAFAVPHSVIGCASLPHTPTGKVDLSLP